MSVATWYLRGSCTQKTTFKNFRKKHEVTGYSAVVGSLRRVEKGKDQFVTSRVTLLLSLSSRGISKPELSFKKIY